MMTRFSCYPSRTQVPPKRDLSNNKLLKRRIKWFWHNRRVVSITQKPRACNLATNNHPNILQTTVVQVQIQCIIFLKRTFHLTTFTAKQTHLLASIHRASLKRRINIQIVWAMCTFLPKFNKSTWFEKSQWAQIEMFSLRAKNERNHKRAINKTNLWWINLSSKMTKSNIESSYSR